MRRYTDKPRVPTMSVTVRKQEKKRNTGNDEADADAHQC